MITQDDFVATRKADWGELETLLGRSPALHRLPPQGIARVAGLYRSVCADLVRAQGAGYGPEVVSLLDGLAARAHNALYSAPPYRMAAVWDLVRADFPRALRRHARFFALGVTLFLLPGILGFVGALRSRAFALQVLSPAMAEHVEEAYKKGFGEGRSEAVDTAMAGFYVYNNIGIAFQCFATGVLFGLGSVFFLVYNGLLIGAVAGLVTAAGGGWNLLTFTAGHGPFELTAIVISGTAGMVMGYALVDTGGRTRFGSLRAKSKDLAHLVLGAALMLLIAALIEGFWSPSGVRAPIKWAVGGAGYTVVALYLALAGRRGDRTEQARP
jgi:uncharacterized membrane protein SpoIIM required for sporulation